MFKLNKIAGSVIAATAILGSAGVALADGYVPKGKVAYERPTNWSGFYFGVSSGYAWSSYDAEFTGFGTTFGVDPNAAIVGAHIGLQHQFGSVVLGGEGNWQTALRGDGFDDTSCPGATFTCAARFNDVLTVGGRLGWAAGHWMPYVTGGYATARFESEIRTAATGALRSSSGGRHDGWYIGGGVEWAVSPGWTVGVEYRHYELGDATYDFTAPGGAVLAVDQTVADVTLDTVSARVSWRWGRPEPRPLK